MEYTIRGLEFGDLFTAVKIVKKVNIKSFVREFGSVDKEGKSKEEIKKIQNEKGFDFFMHILENMDAAEVEIMKLMADISGLKIEDIKKLKLHELKEFYDKLIAANPIHELVSFFKQAMGSMK